ncbi:MAG: menaquinone biosynthesis decarboxylase [Epsilonproteobacteria bacterium]|nr:menaquinone biosynthesis decarboxylase [Campylobacterota bacterium]
MTSDEFIEILKQKSLLTVISDELDVNLEIPHIAYLQARREIPKVLLFTNPVDKAKNIKYDIPVLMNIFNKNTLDIIFPQGIESIQQEIKELLQPKKPSNIFEKFEMLKTLFSLKHVFPKKTIKKLSQEVVITQNIDLEQLPILKTWQEDGGKFITMGSVYTKSLDGKKVNVGMYRLQVYDKTRLGLHWQIHKDSNHFFHEYKKAGKKMPVSITIGGDPLYTWAATAPLPIGINELFLYGFIKKQNPKVIKSITNDIYVPYDADIVIEGYCDPSEMEIEGMFGDHTGYYTLKEPYPVLNVTAITHRKSPIFYATVVGKPPLEDKYMGLATERIFLPLLQTQTPDLVDYRMPENGVFHNLILCKIAPLYKGHSLQIAHALWGVGQMSFVKHAIFVDDKAGDLNDYDAITRHILQRFHPKNILISKGVVDALDHASDEMLVGGKMGIDCTADVVENTVDVIDDEQLLQAIKLMDESVIALKQYYRDTPNPICVIQYNKKQKAYDLFQKLLALKNHLRIVVFVDQHQNDVNDAYMLIWRVVNNIDASRDVFLDEIVGIDGTNKGEIDGFQREWPHDVNCTKSVIDNLQKRGLIEVTDYEYKMFIKDYHGE